MLKEWNDSSKCYPRNRKIVSGKNGKITSNRCWKLWPTHQTQVWGEMQTISFLRWRLNHNSSELSHNFQNWNLDTFLPSLTVAYSSVFREKTAQMILGNPNCGIALLQVVWTENYDMRWGMRSDMRYDFYTDILTFSFIDFIDFVNLGHSMNLIEYLRYVDCRF